MQPLHADGLDVPGPYQLARQPPAASRSRPASAGRDIRRAARSSRSARTGRWSAPTRASAWPGRGCGARRASPTARRSRRRPGAHGASEALEGYTTEAARIVGEEHLVRPDRAGDARRPDRAGADPVDCPADELPDVPVLLTVVDGADRPPVPIGAGGGLAVVGGGILGLAVARELRCAAGRRVVVLEREAASARSRRATTAASSTPGSTTRPAR